MSKLTRELVEQANTDPDFHKAILAAAKLLSELNTPTSLASLVGRDSILAASNRMAPKKPLKVVYLAVDYDGAIYLFSSKPLQFHKWTGEVVYNYNVNIPSDQDFGADVVYIGNLRDYTTDPLITPDVYKTSEEYKL